MSGHEGDAYRELAEDYRRQLLEAKSEIATLQRERDSLVMALRGVMIGGNHVALLIGANHPSDGATCEDAMNHYGPGDQYEAWCCWKTIRDAMKVLRQYKVGDPSK